MDYEYLSNFIFSVNGFFTDILPDVFEIIYYYGYVFLYPILFSTVAYIVVLLIRRIRGC